MSAEMANVGLPEPFAQLQPFVQRWAVAGMANRAALRGASTEDERRAFYEAAHPLIGPILEFMDAKPFDKASGAESALYNMAMAYVHIALAMEIQKDGESRHAVMRRDMPIVHEPTPAL